MIRYTTSRREVICADAIEWLKQQPDHSLQSVITSLPDAEEVGMSFDAWSDWFVSSVELIMQKVRKDQYIFFYQTDRKQGGRILDKSYLVVLASTYTKIKHLFHKIVLKRSVGSRDLFRPTFTHLLGFSFDLGPGVATPDVIECGQMLYKNAMGMNAVELCLSIIGEKSDTIIDPFCGQGSVMVISNTLGKKAIGIDIDPEQCLKSADKGYVISDDRDDDYSLDDDD